MNGMFEGYRMVIRTNGGPDAIEYETHTFASPAAGEILIETEAVGLNFIDVYFRTGLYPATLPFTLGSESAGRVVAIGANVSGFAIGDLVGCVQGDGAYASHRKIKATQAARIPDGISSEIAAASMLKGFTASYLAEDIVSLKAGDVALVHSAAGGVGSMLVPWLRDKGVIVVAHVGSEEKALGVEADHILTCPFQDLPQNVLSATTGRKADVVYDGVGQASWQASLACLRRRGMMVSYGNASGAVPPVMLTDLMRAGSLSVIRPTLADYIASPEELESRAALVFDRFARGIVKPVIGQRLALKDASAAHQALEARQTTGSTILLP